MLISYNQSNTTQQTVVFISNSQTKEFAQPCTFSNFVYDVENLGHLGNRLVKELNVYVHISWRGK